ncbi:hypothetical protein [Carboxylicivirga sp. N1Y90]|uniref:hypothetical protein n=1 Tax=Carboxylicivirga fragile TaxID=3417571 RepID=UPI003D34D004|nr:hypothetical protein [Marinilabiliaceae bacterium N1Y90]
MEKSTIITLSLLAILTTIILLISTFKSDKRFDIKRKVKLLPYWSKYIGVLLAISSLILRWNDSTTDSSSLGYFWQFGFIIGGLVISLSKEKHEDEMTMSLRLNSVFIAFFAGIIAHIFFVLLNLLSGGNIDENNSLYSTGYILFLYILNFQIAKRRLLK